MSADDKQPNPPRRSRAKRTERTEPGSPIDALAPDAPKAPAKRKAAAKPKAPAKAKAAPKPRAPRKPRTELPDVVDTETASPTPPAPAKPRAPRKPRSKVQPAPAPLWWEFTPAQRRNLCLGGIVFAISLLLGMYWRFTVDYPYYDQWDFVPFLQKAYEGQLTRADFWAQHNEHRLVFPRLLMLVMARLSDWNIRWELAANAALASLTLAVLCAQAKAAGKRVHQAPNDLVYLLFTLMLLSLSQWQNWFLGWQLQEFMNVLAVVLAFIALGWRGLPGVGVGFGVCFGFIATYSFANGMLVWPIGLAMLIVLRNDLGKYAKEEIIVWVVAGVLVVASYLRGYAAPEYNTPLSSALAQPLQCVLYVLAYLGQPVWNLDPIISIVMGIVGLLLWSVTLMQLLLSRVPIGVLAPWSGMAIYALGTASITAIGRVDNGLDQAMSSRYVTMANLLWIPVALQLFWVAQISEDPVVRRSLPWKVGVLCALLVVASLTGAYRWTERYNAYSALRADVLAGHDLKRLETIYPPAPGVIVERRATLQRLGLGVFREVPVAQEIVPGR